LDITHII